MGLTSSVTPRWCVWSVPRQISVRPAAVDFVWTRSVRPWLSESGQRPRADGNTVRTGPPGRRATSRCASPAFPRFAPRLAQARVQVHGHCI
jgi:hypothetical protein